MLRTKRKRTVEGQRRDGGKRDDRERGMVTAELAITLPAVLTVLFLVVSFGMALVTQIRVSDAAREAARGYAMEMSSSEVRELVSARAGKDATVHVTQSGELLTVTVRSPVGGPWSLLDLTAESSMTALAEAGR